MTSQEYIVETIEKYSDLIYRVAFSRVFHKEIAEDIYQEVCIKFSEKLPKFKSEEHKKAWLIKVTINLSKNYLKSAPVRKNVELDESLNYEDNDQESIDKSVVIEEIEKLPQDYKTVIYLYYYEGYKVSEIANLMSTKENTIKTWLMRARETLKKNLEGGFGDDE